ncbi:MAG: hypothetical protein H0W07_05825 [Chloroflexi bacterium]|nr:hypothetical protein [Chloroflexota bacterium]
MTMLGASLVMAAAGSEFGGRPPASATAISSVRVAAGPTSSADGTAGGPSPGGTAATTQPSGPSGPTLTGPETVFIRTLEFDVTGTLPDGLTQRGRQRIRIYVDGKVARHARLPAGSSFVVRSVPLKVGRHRITASVRGPQGETRKSTPIIVTVDQTPPGLELTAPADGQVINAENATLEGRIVGGEQVSVRNDTTGTFLPAPPDGNGAFTIDVPMIVGANVFVVTGQDRAGNVVEARVQVLRSDNRPTAGLRISSERIRISRLPASIWLQAQVRDADRRPVPDAPVTFTLSPPGQPTTTYRATTDQLGFARWDKVTLPRDGAQPGKGFATVHVVLPGGETIQETAPFTFH